MSKPSIKNSVVVVAAIAVGWFGSDLVQSRGNSNGVGQGGLGPVTPAEVVVNQEQEPQHLRDLPALEAGHELSASTGGWIATLNQCYELSATNRRIDDCLSKARGSLSTTKRGLKLTSPEATAAFDLVESTLPNQDVQARKRLQAVRTFVAPWLEQARP